MQTYARDAEVEAKFLQAWERDELMFLLTGEHGYYLDNGRNEWGEPQCYHYVLTFGFQNYWLLNERSPEVPARFLRALDALLTHPDAPLAGCCLMAWLSFYDNARREGIEHADNPKRQIFEIDWGDFGTRYQHWLISHRNVFLQEQRYRGDAENHWAVTVRVLKYIRDKGGPDFVPPTDN